jgi:predicted HD phosphohydrolase
MLAPMRSAEGTVSFTRMADGTAEDYALLGRYEDEYLLGLPDRLLRALGALDGSFGGYRVTRFEHSLQAATRAHRDCKDEGYVVATLLHDIGDELAPYTHGEMVAAVLRPYVDPAVCWMIGHHGAFQLYYYGHHTGQDRNARDRWRDHPNYDMTVEFCERYDQASFDPDYDAMPLEAFEPMVRRVFAEPRFLTGIT